MPGLPGLVSSWSEFVRADSFAGVTGPLLADVSGPLVLPESARTGGSGGTVPREIVAFFDKFRRTEGAKNACLLIPEITISLLNLTASEISAITSDVIIS